MRLGLVSRKTVFYKWDDWETAPGELLFRASGFRLYWHAVYWHDLLVRGQRAGQAKQQVEFFGKPTPRWKLV